MADPKRIIDQLKSHVGVRDKIPNTAISSEELGPYNYSPAAIGDAEEFWSATRNRLHTIPINIEAPPEFFEVLEREDGDLLGSLLDKTREVILALFNATMHNGAEQTLDDVIKAIWFRSSLMWVDVLLTDDVVNERARQSIRLVWREKEDQRAAQDLISHLKTDAFQEHTRLVNVYIRSPLLTGGKPRKEPT